MPFRDKTIDRQLCELRTLSAALKPTLTWRLGAAAVAKDTPFCSAPGAKMFCLDDKIFTVLL